MDAVYKTNPWLLPELSEYPAWPFHDIDFWHLGNVLHEVRVKEEEFPFGVTFASQHHEFIRARDAFLCAGLLMSPATYPGGARAWGFYLEFIESLRSSSGKLRIKGECLQWDERVRTIFAERLAVGLAGWLLWNRHNVVHIADAAPFISKAIYDPSSPYHRKGLLFGKNGGLKPDFFCLTSSGECVIAEAKGAIGPPSKLKGDKAKGKLQVENVNPVGIAVRAKGGRLVLASNLRHEAENPQADKESCITVVDPEGNDRVLQVNVTADEIALHSYCKLLSLCGLTMISKRLLRGHSVEIRNELLEIEGRMIFPLLKRDDQVLGLEANVAKALFRNSGQLSLEINDVLPLRDFDGIMSTERMFRLPNGVVYGEIDKR